MSDVLLEGVCKDVTAHIYQVDTEVGWAYISHRGAAMQRPGFMPEPSLFGKSKAKGVVGKISEMQALASSRKWET